MMRNSQTAIIEVHIEKLVDAGEHDIQKIYTIICSELGVPRPSVRRAKKNLLMNYRRRIEILDNVDREKA